MSSNALNSSLRPLYPAIEPYSTGFLKVQEPHELYYEECGNKDGKPIVFLHGGPGGGTPISARQFFAPDKYRIVLFDQRGAGRSRPAASLENNTTWHLVDDIEKLREHLKIEKWAVFGGSWGSTLALAYAETHPKRVTALILRGIFTLRRSELLFFYQEGSSWIMPQVWEKFLEPIPEVQRGDLMSAYYRYLTGPDDVKKAECARAWTLWEMATAKLVPDATNMNRADDPLFAAQFARIECHYFVNGGFWRTDSQLLDDAHIIRDHNIPTTIVQGQYDLVCPAKTAWELHKKLPHAEFVFCPRSGHSSSEPEIIDQLVRATDKYAEL